MSHWLEERRKDDERHAERNRKAGDYDRVAAELARLRLTPEEREAVEIAVEYVGSAYQVEHYAAVLRRLLERLK